mmetsp:Transcript_57749/g.159876  ORF Transcript_57749/g.159876 Transcript_57749/m.159876 type:complete len:210 (-) Transcript_57749:402-1031(-)
MEMKPLNCLRLICTLPPVVSTCTLPPSAILAASMMTAPVVVAALRFSRATTPLARTLPLPDLRLKTSEVLSLASTRPLMPSRRMSEPVPSELLLVTPSTCTSEASPMPTSSQSLRMVLPTSTLPRLVLSRICPKPVPRLMGSHCASTSFSTISPAVVRAEAPSAPSLVPSKVTGPMVAARDTWRKRGASAPAATSAPVRTPSRVEVAAM